MSNSSTAAGASTDAPNPLAALAKKADKEFENKKYDACLELLTKVEKLKKDENPKVQHNIGLAK